MVLGVSPYEGSAPGTNNIETLRGARFAAELMGIHRFVVQAITLHYSIDVGISDEKFV
jgi:hypothetical protein